MIYTLYRVGFVVTNMMLLNWCMHKERCMSVSFVIHIKLGTTNYCEPRNRFEEWSILYTNCVIYLSNYGLFWFDRWRNYMVWSIIAPELRHWSEHAEEWMTNFTGLVWSRFLCCLTYMVRTLGNPRKTAGEKKIIWRYKSSS